MKPNSLNLTTSRYVAGGITEATSTKLEWWERRIFDKDNTDELFILTKEFEHRPELIAYTFYGDTSLWWFILQYNNILDPITEFVEGLVLMIPDKDRALAMISNAQIGGVASTRYYK